MKIFLLAFILYVGNVYATVFTTKDGVTYDYREFDCMIETLDTVAKVFDNSRKGKGEILYPIGKGKTSKERKDFFNFLMTQDRFKASVAGCLVSKYGIKLN